MRWKSVLIILGLTIILALGAEQDFDDSEDAIVTEENEANDSNEDTTSEESIESYESPVAEEGKYYLADHFDDKNNFPKRWIKSQAKKDDIAEEIAKYDGQWEVETAQKQIWKNDLGLVLKSKAKHAAISSRLIKPFVFNDKPLVVQYEVTMQDGQECGGSYMKLLSAGKDTEDLIKFNDKTPYTIMFGPDKCGNDVKLHFIFRHVNPINGSISEKHCRKPKERLEEPFKDKLPHLYQLVINPDNTFQIRVDHNILNEGSLLTDFNPAVNPPREINDPEDKKPENWDEREKIPDPDSKKPDDWDEDAPPQIPDPNAAKPDGWLDEEEEMIPDPNAKKPEDWDTEIDGEWEAPLIENPICEKAVGCGLWKAPLVANPEYKGKWRAPLIDNPNYQGKWTPKKILNPDYFEDLHPFKMTTISAIGFELWSMSSNIYFDNVLITDSIEFADDWASKTFDLKRRQIDKNSESLISQLGKLTNRYPWVWGLLVVIVGLPLSFIIYTFCSKKEKKESAGKKKKTDEPSPDDESPNSNEPSEKPNDGSGDGGLNRNTSPKSKKLDLEVEEVDRTEDVKDDNDEEAVEEISDENEANSETEKTPETNTEGTRKRKPRKE